MIFTKKTRRESDMEEEILESNALSNADFVNFIREQVLTEFYVTGGDALGCVKATCCALREAGHTVHALSDCITSYDKERLPEMFDLYREVGCIVESSQTAFSL